MPWNLRSHVDFAFSIYWGTWGLLCHFHCSSWVYLKAFLAGLEARPDVSLLPFMWTRLPGRCFVDHQNCKLKFRVKAGTSPGNQNIFSAHQWMTSASMLSYRHRQQTIPMNWLSWQSNRRMTSWESWSRRTSTRRSGGPTSLWDIGGSVRARGSRQWRTLPTLVA